VPTGAHCPHDSIARKGWQDSRLKTFGSREEPIWIAIRSRRLLFWPWGRLLPCPSSQALALS
jgi:hypothetical protein